MIFRPAKSRGLWDTWLFPWEGVYHLFFLETHQTLWDHVGHAVSRDLMHWEVRPSIRTKGGPDQWNEEPTLTGMVVHREGVFYLFVGANFKGVQVVGVHTSNDLEHWAVHPASPVMRPSSPHYLAEPVPPFFGSVDWRDPCISLNEEDGYYHAFVCARLPEWSHADTGAAVGHMRSRDLIHWENLPPAATPGGHFYHTEVPDVFRMGDHWYLGFATLSHGALRLDTATKDAAVGTFYLMGETFEGPYTKPDDCLLVGSGNYRMDAYVGRSIPYDGGRLLYHHMAGERPAWGAPKRIRQNADGTLWLEYLPILEKLETEVVVEGFEGTQLGATECALGEWQRGDKGLTVQSDLLGSAAPLEEYVADAHLCTEVRSEGAGRVGILFRHRKGEAAGVLLDFTTGQAHIGTVTYNGFSGAVLVPLDSFRLGLRTGQTYRLRVFIRDEHVEAYLDERWIFSTLLKMPAGGEPMLYAEGGRAVFETLRVAALEPFPEF